MSLTIFLENLYKCFSLDGTIKILLPFQITCRFGFSGYISFAMHLADIYLCLKHNKRNVSRKVKATSNLGRREYIVLLILHNRNVE
jgi:hypothetical protein